MPLLTTAATVTATARLLSPIVTDIYKGAKGKVQKDLANWSSAINIRGIAKTLSKIETVKTLWSPDKEVSLHDFYYPSKIVEDSRNRRINSIDDLPDGNVTIQGIVGQGKSIFMRFLASTAIRSKIQGSIPLFLELRTLSAKLSLKAAIFKSLEAVGVEASEESFSYLANSGRLLLLLDGFDETPEECVKDVCADLEYFQIKYPDFRIIVSSRPGNEIQKTTGFRVIELAQLEKADYSPFLDRLNVPAPKRSEIVRAISNSPSHIAGIIKTPLMLTLVLMVYETEREIPPTLPEFFERLFQVVFTRHDRLKVGFNRKHHSGLSERRLQLLFEAFCFMALQFGYGRSLSSEQFASAFDAAIEYTPNCGSEVEKFRLDITKVACLMLEEGLDLATFLHKSIVEYYAASFIKHSADDVATLFYQSALSNFKQWEAVLSFLKEIDAYRYARDYTMREVPPILDEVEILNKGKNRNALFAYVERHQPRIGVGFLKEPSKKVKADLARYYGPLSPPTAECMKRLPDLITDAVQRSIPTALTSQELDGILVDTPHGESVTGLSNEAHLSYATAARHFGDAELWLSLALFEKALRADIASAKAVIDGQEKRKLIFQKKA
jgi:NACHT domain